MVIKFNNLGPAHLQPRPILNFSSPAAK